MRAWVKKDIEYTQFVNVFLKLGVKFAPNLAKYNIFIISLSYTHFFNLKPGSPLVSTKPYEIRVDFSLPLEMFYWFGGARVFKMKLISWWSGFLHLLCLLCNWEFKGIRLFTIYTRVVNEMRLAEDNVQVTGKCTMARKSLWLMTIFSLLMLELLRSNEPKPRYKWISV